MIEIKITEPRTHSAEELMHLSNYFAALAGRAAPAVEVTPVEVVAIDTVPTPVETPVVIDTATVFAPTPVVEEDIPAPASGRDAQGVPWDRRIHAGTKTMNKDGTWKKLRGVDDALVLSVMTELTNAVAAVAPPPPPFAPESTMTFPQFMQKVTSSGIAPATVIEAVKSVGVDSIPLLGTVRPDLIPAVAAKLGLV